MIAATTPIALFDIPMTEVRLYFAPTHIFQQNLLSVINGKTYKPELAEVQAWNFIVQHYRSARELLAYANSEEAMVMRSPFVGDVIRLTFGDSVGYWSLSPHGDFWRLDDEPMQRPIAFTTIQRIAKGDGLLALLAADQDDDLVFSCECA